MDRFNTPIARGIRKAERAMEGLVGVVRAIATAMTILFLVLLLFQVTMRYVFNNPIYGIDELVTALMVWSSALGTVVVYWERGHAMIEWLRKFLNPMLKFIFGVVTHLITLAVTAIFIPSGFKLFTLQKMQAPVGGLPFGRAYYFSLPLFVMGIIGTILCLFRLIEYIVLRDEHLLVRGEEEGGTVCE